MSSRAEEKAARRAEREAAEAEAARAQARKGRIQLALDGLVAVGAIAIAAVVLGTSGGGNGGSSGKTTDPAKVAIPPQKDNNLQTAAKTAGCTLKTYPSEGREHTTAKVNYKTNPPTSGNHNPVPAEDGIYDTNNAPEIGNSVHSLEHGRIEIQYKPGTPKATIDQLETLGSEKLQFGTDAYHVLVFQNQTNMPAAVAATAWTQSLTCPKMDDGVFDAIRDFRTQYTDKGPELIP